MSALLYLIIVVEIVEMKYSNNVLFKSVSIKINCLGVNKYISKLYS